MPAAPLPRLSRGPAGAAGTVAPGRSLRLLYGWPWLAVLATVGVALRLPGRTVGVLAVGALAVSVLFFGLPHGSADWWIMRRAAGARWARGARVWLPFLYVLASLLTLAFWWWQPGAALVGFLALTAWHFGSADAAVLLPARSVRDAPWWLFAVGRGLLVVFTPLAFRPAEGAAILLPFASLAHHPGQVVAGILHAALPLLWAGAALLTVGLQLAKGGRPVWPRDPALTCGLLETGVLLALFRLAPPLLSFACYWVMFHCWRHVWRVEGLLHPGVPLPPGLALADFHRRTLPLTLLSLLGLGLIFALWPALSGGPAGWRTAYFVLLSALTVPHALVIGWLDVETAPANRPLSSPDPAGSWRAP